MSEPGSLALSGDSTYGGKPFQILAIDGGGLKGIFAAAALAELEKDFDCCIVDHFDLIAGTSTGGLIALGLGAGMTAAEVLDFYLQHERAIFPTGSMRWRKRIASPYPAEPLRLALEEQFGDRKFGESVVRLVIPSFDLANDDVYVFRTPHNVRLRRDWPERVVDVALATSAAPTFLPAHSLRDHRLIDGGVWANNPSMAGVVEAIEACSASRSSVRLLNVGTTAEVIQRPRRLDRAGLVRWAPHITDVVLRGQGLASYNQAMLLLGSERVHRLNVAVPKGSHSLDGVQADDLRAKAQHQSRRAAPTIAHLFDHQPTPYRPEYK